jgi:hypothetical protein
MHSISENVFLLSNWSFVHFDQHFPVLPNSPVLETITLLSESTGSIV